VHGLLGQTGFRVIQVPTFVPAYIYMLTGANSVVGIARACQALGMFLTPIVGATLIERRRRVLPVVFATGALMRLQVLGLALAGFFLGTRGNVIAVCVFLGLFGFFTGMQSVTFSFLVSKMTPVDRRGSLVGFRNALGGLTASVVGAAGGFMIEREVLGNGYASLFLLSFVLTATGLCAMFFVREPSSPDVKPATPLAARLRQLPALLRADADYRGYMAARALGAAGRMAQPYFIIYLDKRLDLSATELGVLSAAFMIGTTASNLGWGLLADRRGFRAVLVSALAIWIASTLLLTYAPDLNVALVGYVGLAAAFGGFQLACMNLVLEFGEREDLPMRIAMAQSAEQVVSIAAPLLGALMAETVGYQALFWCAAGVQTLALAIAHLRVREPRQRSQPASG